VSVVSVGGVTIGHSITGHTLTISFEALADNHGSVGGACVGCTASFVNLAIGVTFGVVYVVCAISAEASGASHWSIAFL